MNRLSGCLIETYEDDQAQKLGDPLQALRRRRPAALLRREHALGFPFDAPARSSPRSPSGPPPRRSSGGGVLDEGMPKERGEVLVTGSCFAPGGAPPAGLLRPGAGRERRQTPRRRRRPAVAPRRPHRARALHGDARRLGPRLRRRGFRAEPIGKGAAPVHAEGGKVHPPAQRRGPDSASCVGPGDRPAPAGSAPIDITWPQRSSRAGTYDERWSRAASPASPPTWTGDSSTSRPRTSGSRATSAATRRSLVENMHPDKPRIAGALPGAASAASSSSARRRASDSCRCAR